MEGRKCRVVFRLPKGRQPTDCKVGDRFRTIRPLCKLDLFRKGHNVERKLQRFLNPEGYWGGFSRTLMDERHASSGFGRIPDWG